MIDQLGGSGHTQLHGASIPRRVFCGAGGGVSLRLLPNMRIVIEMDGSSSVGLDSQQPLMTPEKTAQIAQASIAAARAAELVVRNGDQSHAQNDSM